MDDLQYDWREKRNNTKSGFKPYYKWMTFNTQNETISNFSYGYVLNLIINGWPSILMRLQAKPIQVEVLNLIINGWPSIQYQHVYDALMNASRF